MTDNPKNHRSDPETAGPTWVGNIYGWRMEAKYRSHVVGCSAVSVLLEYCLIAGSL